MLKLLIQKLVVVADSEGVIVTVEGVSPVLL